MSYRKEYLNYRKHLENTYLPPRCNNSSLILYQTASNCPGEIIAVAGVSFNLIIYFMWYTSQQSSLKYNVLANRYSRRSSMFKTSSSWHRWRSWKLEKRFIWINQRSSKIYLYLCPKFKSKYFTASRWNIRK